MSNIRKAVTSLTLDLSMPDVQAGFTCTLGDRMRVLEILITDGGRPVEMLPRWSAFLSGVKPDETELVNGCVVQDGKIIYDFEMGDQIATCAGAFPVTVWIMDENGTPVASPKIWVNVIDSGVQTIMNNNLSEDQFGVLQEIVENISDLFDKDQEIDTTINGLKENTRLAFEGVNKDINAVKISIQKANDKIVAANKDIDQAKQDIEQAKQDIDQAKTDIDRTGADVVQARLDIMQAKQDIDKTKSDIDQAKSDIDQAKSDIDDIVTIETRQLGLLSWEQNGALITVGQVDNSDVILVIPADEASKNIASKARLYIEPEPYKTESNYITFYVKYKGARPGLGETVNLALIKLKDKGGVMPKVALIGIDTYGDDIPTAIDLSRLDDGEVVETFSDGTTKTTTIEYDEDGNPVKITDGDGNITVLAW